ncbi:DUF5666 domain-containing protein [Nocardia macrotermitis]|uniref:DUF5666 domain-containing protein n=1 Tax=Nocardia macrotermitis TaxID=2585198 RepID=A0A7K0D3I9_9NOCA|nr:hypothetical protein [Nocardia macrotermitis]MQY20279.1 hypothetical protein [Nocardia macrotermitis]
MTAPEQPPRPEQPEHAEQAQTEPVATEPTWGAAQTTPSTWNKRKTIATVGIAAAIAAVGGGVIYAASGNSSEHDRFGGPGGGPGWSMNSQGGGANSSGPGGGNSGPGNAIGTPTLHGQFVISDGNGGYTTELTQTGTVTAISADSITAKSTDSYTHTYTINTTTQSESGLKVGDTVSIRATDANGTSTATVITEPSLSQSSNGLSRRNNHTSGRPGGTNDDTSGDQNQMPSGPGQFGPGGMGGGPGTPMDAQAPTTN